MSLPELFIRRPVATVLVSLAIVLAGLVGLKLLPVSPLPQVDFPTVFVQASLPGASPETMASTVATPLERSLGRIAGVSEMTSSSTLGNTRITLQFDLSRDIDGASRDVQAAINAARTLLPTGMPGNPIYRKLNPADAPIMVLALTSDTLDQGQLYDAGSTILAQRLSQIEGVGQVSLGGSSLPAVRVDINPEALSKYAISLESVRQVLAAANANRPKGLIENGDRSWQILAADQARRAADYRDLVIASRGGRLVRLSDVADVQDSVENIRNAGLSAGRPAVVVIVSRQPGANIIETVERVRAALPSVEAQMPAAIKVTIANDRTKTIRASLHDVERTLVISIALVIMVVFIFLRKGRATLVPSVAVPISLVGTFGVMYLLGFSLNNLSLMAITVATGFVVDDAIVVLENISRHIEAGMEPFEAAIRGAREVTFTVISMSVSLIAVFVPVLMMGGIIGRLFREFAVTLSIAIVISLLVSLSLTPMMCSRLLRSRHDQSEGRLARGSREFFERLQAGYRRSLSWAVRHWLVTTVLLLAVIRLNFYLYVVISKSFFPQQDTGTIMAMVQADQSISFQAMRDKLQEFTRIVKSDPAVDSVVGFTGSFQTNSATLFIALKPQSQRNISADEVIGRLRKPLAKVPGATLFMQSVQDIRMGGRPANAQYQYTLQSDDISTLRAWEPKIRETATTLPGLVDVNSDAQEKGAETLLTIDRDAVARLGLSPAMIDATLNDAFGQRQVSTIFMPLNQYHVVMEVAPRFWQSPEALNNIYLINSKGATVPLSAVARYAPAFTALGVNHQSQFVASTISFNLQPGYSMSQATEEIDAMMQRIGVPSSLHGGFQGNAKMFQDSLGTQPLLILAALITMYIVLGMLYESFVHPITILSTLPSAGVGALLALMLCKTDFSIIALIGVLLLVGIVKKNAIMMIDVALAGQRERGLSASDAIIEAGVLRFRPILMTTLAAMLGAVPLAIGHGEGAEIRQPLGIAIVGGLMLSQLLTLYTTPIVFIGLDALRVRILRLLGRDTHVAALPE